MLETNDKRYLNDLLAKNRLMLDKYEKELSRMPEGSLGMREKCSKGKETLYCHYIDGKRKGISKNDELVYKLARKMFLEKSIKTINTNVRNLQRLSNKYENPDAANIISMFPYHYAVLMDRKEAGWNEEKRIWLSEEYKQSTYKPDEKSHTTSKGLHDSNYMNRHNWKMKMYDKAGILPWKNLLVTYDDEEGYLDTRIIDAEIINKLM